MKTYKAPDNSIHCIDPEYSHMLPDGCVEITDQEAEDIRQSQVVPLTYQELRASKYPPITDYLDAIVKGDTKQQQAYIDACNAVKAEFPKPKQTP